METQLLLWIHGGANAPLDTVFMASHLVGSMPASIVLVLVLSGWHLVRRERREALVWLLAGLSTLVLLEGLKALVARSRPELWPRIATQAGFSFPSGHALASATFYPILAWEAARRRLAAPLVCYAVALTGVVWVGLGRLYLGLHWPSDVLAGWALGMLQSTAGLAALGQGWTRSPERRE